MRGKRIAAGRLAGFGAAQLEHMAAGRRAAEVVIEGDDAVHFGARDVQRLGDQRLGRFIDVAELLLQGVQDRQQRAFAIQAFPNALQRDLFIPRNLTSFHRASGVIFVIRNVPRTMP